MASERSVVEVLEWTPEWAERFERDRQELAAVLPVDATIEHIGSTSVPGLAAKPIIDILVVTEHVPDLRADRSAIESLGYTFSPRYFADDPDHLFFRRDVGGRRTEHLHLFHPRSTAPRCDRALRDYLIAHPEEAERYGRAKKAAAAASPDSRADYGTRKEHVLLDMIARSKSSAAGSSRDG